MTDGTDQNQNLNICFLGMILVLMIGTISFDPSMWKAAIIIVMMVIVGILVMKTRKQSSERYTSSNNYFVTPIKNSTITGNTSIAKAGTLNYGSTDVTYDLSKSLVICQSGHLFGISSWPTQDVYLYVTGIGQGDSIAFTACSDNTSQITIYLIVNNHTNGGCSFLLLNNGDHIEITWEETSSNYYWSWVSSSTLSTDSIAYKDSCVCPN